MNAPARRFLPLLVVTLFGFLLCTPALQAAQDHVVTLPELRQAVNTSAQARQANLSQVEKFFSTPRVEKTLKSAHLDPVQIRQAIPRLSDQELARLSARTNKIQQDFAAGSLTNQQITYLLIAIGTALLVTIIFVAS